MRRKWGGSEIVPEPEVAEEHARRLGKAVESEIEE